MGETVSDGPMPGLSRFSYRGIQVYAVISSIIAIAGGGTFVLYGVEGVALVAGTEYPNLVPALHAAAQLIPDATRPTFDTFYRMLGWYWLVTGLLLLWITPAIGTSTAWFRLIHLAFMSTGIANGITIMDSGLSAHGRYGAVIIELLVPTLAMIWQWRVSLYFIKNNAEEEIK